MSVPEVFSWQAAHNSDRPAILDGEGYLTYGDLERLSNQLARQLVQEGVAAGDFVGTATTRSTETLALWLAILKVGAVYLPIDPAYPPAAIEQMLEDTRPSLVLAESRLIATNNAGGSSSVLDLELMFAAAQAQPQSPMAHGPRPTDPAYVMFTSGSTGRPKGVLVPHRAIVRLVRDQSYVEFNENETFLHISALAFDASTWEIWGALLNGGRIAVVRGERISIPQIAHAIEHYGATTVFLTSALFNAIVDIDVEALAGLRQIMVGGDVVSPQHVFKAMKHLPDADFINGYGPTEATTFSVCYRMPREGWGPGGVPIGVPLNNTHAYVLSEDLTRVPDGEVGQLWIGGDGVALGYLNRPELTAERFRQDPCVETPGALMYDTGDLVRRRPDGVLQFHGRKDRQIKVDGKRIELDEIEFALRKSPAVGETMVSFRSLGPAQNEIVAFVRPAPDVHADNFAGRLAAELRERLPQHMIPSRIVAVQELPLTTNGKVDKSALMQLLEK